MLIYRVSVDALEILQAKRPYYRAVSVSVRLNVDGCHCCGVACGECCGGDQDCNYQFFHWLISFLGLGCCHSALMYRLMYLIISSYVPYVPLALWSLRPNIKGFAFKRRLINSVDARPVSMYHRSGESSFCALSTPYFLIMYPSTLRRMLSMAVLLMFMMFFLSGLVACRGVSLSFWVNINMV